ISKPSKLHSGFGNRLYLAFLRERFPAASHTVAHWLNSARCLLLRFLSLTRNRRHLHLLPVLKHPESGTKFSGIFSSYFLPNPWLQNERLFLEKILSSPFSYNVQK